MYHCSDLDGRGSAALVKHHYAKRNASVDLIPMNHGYEIPWDRLDQVDFLYMVDFVAGTVEDMERLSSMCRMIWIDHHKTAIDIQERNPSIKDIAGIRMNGISAIELTWGWLQHMREAPLGIHLLGRYDIWDLKDQRTKIFQAACNSVKNDLHTDWLTFWCPLIEEDERWMETMMERGQIVLETNSIMYKNLCNTCSFPVTFEGLDFLVMNCPIYSSMIFEDEWDSITYDAMMVFAWAPKIRKWRVSMYTDKEGIDVSTIAKKMGGGGHIGAAGFECKELPFKLEGKF
jgi:oligoribonuclease NrnB/cAMP/cGMP phosphodiesterase (DHH superfamily)